MTTTPNRKQYGKRRIEQLPLIANKKEETIIMINAKLTPPALYSTRIGARTAEVTNKLSTVKLFIIIFFQVLPPVQKAKDLQEYFFQILATKIIKTIVNDTDIIQHTISSNAFIGSTLQISNLTIVQITFCTPHVPHRQKS